jgi:ABC-type oligopeptide transport system ATPase subunit
MKKVITLPNTLANTLMNKNKDVSKMKKILLKVINLSVSFKKGLTSKKALNEVSFDIFENEILGVIGESGSGKTTIAKAIMGLNNSCGQVVFENKQINDYKINLKKIANSIFFSIEETKILLIKLVKRLMKNLINFNKYHSLVKQICKLLNNSLIQLNILSTLLKDVGIVTNAVENEKDKNKNSDSLSTIKLIIAKVRNSLSTLYDLKKFFSRKEKEFAFANKENTPFVFETENDTVLLNKVNSLSRLILSIEKIVFDKKTIEITEHKYEKNKNQKLLRKDIQMIMQDPSISLNERMKIQEIILEGFLNFKKVLIANGETQNSILEKTLSSIGLPKDILNKYSFELSGGQKQRVSIARSIIMKPKIIVADEPISSLDVTIRAQILNLLKKIKNEMKLSILFISHDLSTIHYFCDRIIVVYKGNIVEIVDSDELHRNPIHPYTKKLLSSSFIPEIGSKIYPEKECEYNNEDEKYLFFPRKFVEILPNHFVFCNDYEKES